MVENVITEAQSRRDVAVRDAHEAARSVVAQLEGQVLFAKFGSTRRLDTLWENSSAVRPVHCAKRSPPELIRQRS
jgi:TetR/AcrR family transcriptional repressor of nem operon